MTEWRRVRLKHLALVPIVNGVGEPGEYEESDWPRYVRTTDIEGPRHLRDDVFKSLPPAIADRAPLRRGDLVMVAAGATIGKSYLHVSDQPACFAGYLVRFRPREGVDSRFIAYWTESAPYLQQIESQHVKATIENFSAARYRNLVLDVPSYVQQRTIADFLDRETARIDFIIARRRQLLALVRERERFLFGDVLRKNALSEQSLDIELAEPPVGWRVIRLSKLLVQLTNGYVGPTRDILLEDGVRYIQSVHIKDGGIDFDRRPYFVSPQWHLQHTRTALKPGDLLIVQTGDVGQVALVPEDFGEANCHALLIGRVQPSMVRPRYLYHFFRSYFGLESLVRETTGALHPHLEAGKVRDIYVFIPSLLVQDGRDCQRGR